MSEWVAASSGSNLERMGRSVGAQPAVMPTWTSTRFQIPMPVRIAGEEVVVDVSLRQANGGPKKKEEEEKKERRKERKKERKRERERERGDEDTYRSHPGC